jgi:hypothetical protein
MDELRCFGCAGVGKLQCKHDCPHHGARLMPFLLTPLGCIFMGAVLFNGNVENCGTAYLSELLPNVNPPPL